MKRSLRLMALVILVVHHGIESAPSAAQVKTGVGATIGTMVAVAGIACGGGMVAGGGDGAATVCLGTIGVEVAALLAPIWVPIVGIGAAVYGIVSLLTDKGKAALQAEMNTYDNPSDLAQFQKFIQANGKGALFTDATVASAGIDSSLLMRMQTSFVKIQAANLGIDPADLVQLCPPNASMDSFSVGFASVNATVGPLQAQGFAAADVISMAKNTSYLPDGFNGTLLEKVTLISNTISANPNITKSNLVADTFKAAAVVQQNAASSEPGVGPGTEPSSGSGPSSGPSSSGAGKASVPSTDTPSAFDTLKASVMRQQATLDKYISQGKAGSQTFETQQASIQQQINSSTGEALELAKAKARQLMTDSPDTKFTDEDGKPLTIEG